MMGIEGTVRNNIRPGLRVSIVLKKDQPTGRLTEGTVRDILTPSPVHHRGIKVRLTDGQVGRVQIIHSDGENDNAGPDNTNSAENPVGRFMVAAGAVIELADSGRILLMQRSSSLDWQASEWEIPYGRLAQFEDLESGLRREVYEETGLNMIVIHGILRTWHIFRGPENPENELIGITFHVKTGTDTVRLSAEHDGYRWVYSDEAFALLTNDGIAEDVRKFTEMESGKQSSGWNI